MSKAAIPKDLTPGARKIFKEIAEEYGIDDPAGMRILYAGCMAWERAVKAREQIDADGMMIEDRWKQRKPHPLLAAERDARAQFLAAMKALNLDLEPLRDGPGRPGGR